MSSATENLEKMLSQRFIVDPSVVSRPYGFHTLWFLRDKYKPSNVILPTSLYHALREGSHKEILFLLKKWQWRLPIAEAEEWIKSPKFAQEVSDLLEISSPASEFWRLKMDPPVIEEIAEEIREVSARFSAPLVAKSRCFKRWLSKKAVTILEVSNEEYKMFKRNLRREYQRSLKVRLGVRGIQWVLVGALLITVVLALQPGALPLTLASLFPSTATLGGNLLYQAIVVDP